MKKILFRLKLSGKGVSKCGIHFSISFFLLVSAFPNFLMQISRPLAYGVYAVSAIAELCKQILQGLQWGCVEKTLVAHAV